MAPIEIDDDDDDEVPSLVPPTRARESSRRSVSRAPSVASNSNKAGTSRASMRTVGDSGSAVASTSRSARARSSVSATPEIAGFEQSLLPTSEATLESDTPTVAAYSSRAAVRSTSQSKTPPAKARSKPKKPQIDPKAQAELARRRQEEEDADDFFTHKSTLSFVTKNPASKLLKQVNGGKPTTVPVLAAKDLQNTKSLSPHPPISNKGKERVIELDDDDDESESSPVGTSDSEDAESDPYETKTPKQKAKSKKKKAQPEIRRPSPLKRPEPAYDSSSSSSSTYSFSSSSSLQHVRKDKHKDKKKKAAVEAERERSLSPIETVDSYVLAHALHDVRRKNNARQASIAQDLDSDPLASGAGDAGPSTSRVNANALSPAPEDRLGRHLRSPSANASDPLPPRGTSFSLTPLPESKPLTDEELEAKFGAAVVIKVEMVYDPRLPITDLNREQVKKFENILLAKTREKETFHRLFTAISTVKSIPKEQLAFTYNGKTVYQSGSPSALKIISNATFKGYSKDVLAYVKQHGEGVLERHNKDIANVAAGASDSAPNGPGNNQGNSESIPAAATAPAASTATANEATNQSPEAPQLENLRLTVRAGPDQIIRLAIPPTKTVLSVIKHFLKKMKIDPGKAGQCKMLFDGEELDHDSQFKDTDVEDEDTLDVKIPA